MREFSRCVARAACILIALTAAALPLRAQEPASETPARTDRRKAFIVQIAGGAAMSFGPEQTVPADAKETRLGAALTARALWRPGHLLAIGIGSGYTRISTLETSASARVLHLSAVPAMVLFSMESRGFDLTAAGGWQRYIVGTEGRTISSAWEMSYALTAGYRFNLGEGLGLGAEVSFASIPERSIDIVSMGLRAQYTLEY